MRKLGLDFDNTLVEYDELFYTLAREKRLIERDCPANKKAIRNYLNEIGLEEAFTELQGEVYGLRILEAKPADGMIEALTKMRDKGYELMIVSHKTKKPYRGPAYDLRGMAMRWLEKYHFFEEGGLNMKKGSVYFEDSKKDKIKRIEELGCNIYIDDLLEILKMLNSKVLRLHYSKSIDTQGEITTFDEWTNLPNIIKKIHE